MAQHMAASTIPPLSVWPCGMPFGNTHEGPDRLRSAPITDPLSRGFGIPNRSPDPMVQRAGRDHPIPVFAGLLGGKGTSHIGWDTGEIRGSNPTRPGCPALLGLHLCHMCICVLRRYTSYTLLILLACCALQVSDAGGSRRSYMGRVVFDPRIFAWQVTRVSSYVRRPFPSTETRQISERDDPGPPVVPGGQGIGLGSRTLEREGR